MKIRTQTSSLNEVSKKDIETLASRNDVKFLADKGAILIVGAEDGLIRSFEKNPNGTYEIKKIRRKPVAPGVIEKRPDSPTMEGLRGVKDPPREVRVFDTEPEPAKEAEPKKKWFWKK